MHTHCIVMLLASSPVSGVLDLMFGIAVRSADDKIAKRKDGRPVFSSNEIIRRKGVFRHRLFEIVKQHHQVSSRHLSFQLVTLLFASTFVDFRNEVSLCITLWDKVGLIIFITNCLCYVHFSEISGQVESPVKSG